MSYLTRSIVLQTREPGPFNNQEQNVTVRPFDKLEVGPTGTIRGVSARKVTEAFPLLPATSVAAGASKFFTVAGDATVVIAADTKGGVLLTTKTTPSAGEFAALVGVASTPFSFPIRANQRVFEAVVNLPSIADVIGSFGLNENVTDCDPTGTAGEGVMFLADPEVNVTTGLDAEAHDNWILAYKVNGADTFADSGIPLVAGLDFVFKIEIQDDYTAKCYINDKLVGTSPALTAGDTVKAFLGTETSASAQKSFVARLVSSDHIWA